MYIPRETRVVTLIEPGCRVLHLRFSFLVWDADVDLCYLVLLSLSNHQHTFSFLPPRSHIPF